MFEELRLHLIVPGSLTRRTGGTIYDARMSVGLRRLGCRVEVHELEGRFPDADATARDSLDEALSRVPRGGRVVIDGLAMGALPDVVEAHRERLRTLALVHHPLADETGLSTGQRQRFADLERAALGACDGVIVTSGFTASRLRGLGIGPEKVRAVVPGTDPARPATGPGDRSPPRLLTVGSVIPRKGHEVLVDALCRLQHLSWTCTCVGSLNMDPAHGDAVRRRVAAAGLGGRIELVGECSEARLEEYYDSISVFVLASYYEGFGMVLREAIAHGLPVVSTTGGAIPEAVPAEAAMLVEPGDPGALASALGSLLAEPDGTRKRAELAVAACRARTRLRDWDQASRAFAQAVLELTPDDSAELAAAADSPTPATGRGREPLRSDGAERFAADWLALREPVDHRSRPPDLVARLQADWQQRGWSRIADLGSGTGSNLRFLSPRLGRPQEWTLVDRDAQLLACVGDGDDGLRVELIEGDIARQGLSAAAAAQLVTGSALLDLVSETWLRQLVEVCRQATAGAYFALSYDGELRFATTGAEGDAGGRLDADAGSDPDDDPDDELVREAVNLHQLRDKGLGPALGPAAGELARQLFQAAGYRTWWAPSGWRLGAADAELALRLVDGWRDAASEQRPASSGRIHAWAKRRQSTIRRGAFELTVGHSDLLALPVDDGAACA